MEKTKENPSYYAILTANVRYSKLLAPMEKIMFAEITALSQKTGRCFATNSYFAELYDVSTKSISRWVSNLKANGFVSVYQMKEAYQVKGEIKYKQTRYIIANTTPMDTDVHTPLDNFVHTPLDTDVPLITVQDSNNTSNNKNTRDSLKISSNSNEENQTTLKDNEISLNPPLAPNPLIENESKISVKQTEKHRKSTNGTKGKLSYTKEIKSVLECFNLVGNKKSELTDDHSKKIVALLDFAIKKENVEKEVAAANICSYLKERAKEHKVIEDGSKDRFIDKKHFTIDSLLTKPKYTRYLTLKKEMQAENLVKETQKQELKKKNNGLLPNSFL